MFFHAFTSWANDFLQSVNININIIPFLLVNVWAKNMCLKVPCQDDTKVNNVANDLTSLFQLYGANCDYGGFQYVQ